ncbi:MAG: ribosome maturation factor RimP, partial [Oscillospiraceae bacterium]|nr:ribosome maturation factor RimP [Oscillospiraceae bacterium]
NVEVKLYKAVEDRKSYQGILSAYEDGKVSVDVSGIVMSFEKEVVASVRLRVVI